MITQIAGPMFSLITVMVAGIGYQAFLSKGMFR
jgi:hypothetical protein